MSGPCTARVVHDGMDYGQCQSYAVWDTGLCYQHGGRLPAKVEEARRVEELRRAAKRKAEGEEMCCPTCGRRFLGNRRQYEEWLASL